MKKKQKMDLGGIVSSLFNIGNNSDPMENLLLQRYEKMVNTPNYIEDPNATLADNEIKKARATLKSESNPWTQGLDILGSLAVQKGTGIMGGAQKATTLAGTGASDEGLAGFLNKLFGQSSITEKKAYGGRTKNHNVEVEGKEVGELPNGQILDFQGPSHEQGGIDTTLPEGTKMFSKRIKIDGKTMAERKKKREREEAALTKKLAGNKGDKLTKNTLDRILAKNKKEDALDLRVQEAIADNTNSNRKGMQNTNDLIEYQLGTGPDGIVGNTGGSIEELFMPIYKTLKLPQAPGLILPTPTPIKEPVIPNEAFGFLPTQEEAIPGKNKSTAGLPTAGDALGILGNLKQAYDPYFTTLENRATDTPNINPYKDFGKDGLEVLDKTKSFLAGERDANLQELLLAKNGAAVRNRNTARSINTQRALDLATEANYNKGLTSVYTDFANKMMGILSQEAGMENMQDQVVMRGEEKRDLEDRQDKDAFYTNLARDRQAIGEGISRTGKSINEIKTRGVNENFLNMLGDYLGVDIMSGKVRQRNDINIGNNNQTPTVIGGIPQSEKEALKNIKDTDWNNFINPETGKVFKSASEFYEAYKKRNKYSDAFKEFDSEYKKYIDPTTKSVFSSKKDFEDYLSVKDIKDLDKYITPSDRLTGTKVTSKVNFGTAKPIIEDFLTRTNMNLNLGSIKEIKALQKLLGVSQTGNFGPLTLEAMKKYKK